MRTYKTPEAKRLYQLQYCEKNRERERLRVRAYFKQHRDAILAKRREERANNPDAVRARARNYNKRNRARVLECKRASYQRCKKQCAITNARWVKNNKERAKAIKRAWSKRNPEYMLAAANKRRAIKKLVTAGDCRAKTGLLRMARFCHWCCAALNDNNRTVDHVVPLARGGGHTPDNLVAACKTCNYSKGKKLISEWTWKMAA